MDVLWAGEPMTVRNVVDRLDGELAYTTVMTTLDRLYKKGLLARDRQRSAFVYQPALSRDAYHRALVEQTIGELLPESSGAVLAAFVDTAARTDEEHLVELERLIAAHRRRRRR